MKLLLFRLNIFIDLVTGRKDVYYVILVVNYLIILFTASMQAKMPPFALNLIEHLESEIIHLIFPFPDTNERRSA